MKKRKVFSYIVTSVLTASIILSSFPIHIWATEELDENESLWETSFASNEGEKGFLENTIDAEKGDKDIKGFTTIELIKGDVTTKVVTSSISGSSNFNSSEAKDKVFDGNSSTKWLTNSNTPSVSNPIYVQFNFEEAKTLDRYAVVSANDANERDPKNWSFYGSSDQSNWVVLDAQENQAFTGRFEKKEYSIASPQEFKYYKLAVTANYGNNTMTQFADLLLGTGIKVIDTDLPMVTMLAKGPSEAWNQKSNAGWDDENSLQVSGTHVGVQDAHSWNVIYNNLNVPITENTALSYLIFPGSVTNEYDYNWTQMNMAVDLKFDDGTYLSDYGIDDINGNVLTPQGQGDSRTLLTNQWNKITARLGEYATLRGKTIKEVLIAYDNRDNKADYDVDFRNYFDDIKLFNEAKKEYDNNNLAEYVNILRGTNDSSNFSRGLTAPIVATPHGFNFWAPVTNSGDNKLYTYQQNGSQGTLKHISVSHEPSYWVGDRGTWEYMVNTSINPSGNGSIGSQERAAEFTHDNEIAKAHYYSVDFTQGNAAGSKLELSPTEHGSSTKFTFDENAQYHNVILDIARGTDKKVTLNEDNKSFTAQMRPNSEENGSNGMKTMYVYGEFDKAWTNKRYGNSNQNSAIVNFGNETTVEMKVATSFISIEQAKRNLELELAGKSFEDVYEEAKGIWNDTLDVINVEGATHEQKVTLYSNLYRTFIYPNLLSENTGTNESPLWKYKSTVSEDIKEGTLYYNNGFWDTYHTTWAQYSLLTPTKYEEMLNGLVEHYNDGGWVPRWVAPGGTNSMVGTSSDIIFADAAVKGADFDLYKAYQSAIKNASVVNVENLSLGGRAELNTSIFRGYTTNSTGEGFSWSMEGYINDYGISQMATILAAKATEDGKSEEAQTYLDEAEYYRNRALNYVLLFDGSSEEVTDKWFKGKNGNGEWSQGDAFDPTFWGNDYTETDAYNMLVTVPQDGNGLANLYGGADALASRMDTIFTTKGTYNGYNAVDGIGGIHEQREAREVKLGQYGHSNQPSHGIIYMYNYAKQPWKTQQYVRDVLKRCYVGGDFGQGYIGDEDNGEMSAWYVLSSLGIFPVNMGSGEYAIGSPLFDKATIDLGNNKKLTIIANNNSDENVYVQSMKLNGEAYNSSFISAKTLSEGGTIEFTMGSTPNTNWGIEGEGTSLTSGDAVANPKEDMSVPKVEVADDLALNVVSDTVAGSGVENIASLFDNDSNSATTFGENTTLYYSFIRPVKVDMVTLTSTKDKQENAPKAFALYGSNDGQDWVSLTSKDNMEFAWGRYTRPFSVHNNDKGYVYYKLELTGGTTLSEIELLGQADDYSSIDKTILAKTVMRALTIDQTNLGDVVKQMLKDSIEAAQTVLDKENATQDEIVAQYLALQQIINRIGNIRDGLTKIEAETYDMSHTEIKNDGPNIGGVKKDTWVGYKDVEFKAAPTQLEVRYSAQNSDACAKGNIEVRLDSRDGDVLFIVDTTKTGGWSNYVTTNIEIPEEVQNQFIGLHDLYFTFVGNDPIDASAAYVANVDYFDFKAIYTQTVTTQGNGQILTDQFAVNYKGAFTLEVQPDDGYKTIKVTVDGEELTTYIPGTNTIDFENINAHHTIVVTFAQDKEFNIIKNEDLEGATVTFTNVDGDEIEKAKAGDNVTVTISDIAEDKKLEEVTVNGKAIALRATRSTGSGYTGVFVMPYSDAEVEVVLSNVPTYQVNVIQGEHGQIQTIGNVDDYIMEGKSLTIKLIPDAGYKVSQLIINQESVEITVASDGTVTYVVQNITDPISVTTRFEVDRNTESLEALIAQGKLVIDAAKQVGIDTNALTKAIEAGQAIVEDPTQTQDAVDNAILAIRIELHRLYIEVSILEAKDKDLSKYTDESVSAYNAILSKAQELLTKEDVSLEELQAMIEELNNMDKVLVEKTTIHNPVIPDETNNNQNGINNQGQTNGVGTGDTNTTQVYVLMIFISMLGAILIAQKKYKKENVNK